MKKTIRLGFVLAMSLPFLSGLALLHPKAVPTEAGFDYTANSWKELQDLVSSASNNQTISIGADLEGKRDGKDLGRILIKGKTLTIDLNGHKVDRQRTSSDKNGHVFELQSGANVTFVDSSESKEGAITGGYASRGGGIHIGENAQCALNGVTVRGNKASVDGGGLYVRGKLSINGATISENEAEDTGGGFFLNSTGTLLEAKSAKILDNVAENDGGGVVLDSKKNITIEDTLISGNKSKTEDGGGLKVKGDDPTVTLQNVTVSNNSCEDNGGGIILFDGDLILRGSTVSGNKSKDGGGIYADGNALKVTEGTRIVNNEASRNGGGLYLNDDNDKKDGKPSPDSISGSEISANIAGQDGGGIDSDDTENLEIKENSSVSSNAAQKGRGGGLFVKKGSPLVADATFEHNSAQHYGGAIMSYVNLGLMSSPHIDENSASVAPEVCFPQGKKFAIRESISAEAHVGVTLIDGDGKDIDKNINASVLKFGTFTTTSSGASLGADKDVIFFSPEGYMIQDNGSGESELIKRMYPSLEGDHVVTDTFIPWNEQIETDTSKIRSNNWLAGISGERMLYEINTPATHDSAMAGVASSTSCAGSFFGYADYAITQYSYINQQMEEGVRCFDLRLNNKRVWKKNQDSGDQKDDGENLFLCHGKSNAGGTHFAEDPDTGYPLNLQKVIDWMEDFLKRNPTEYVVMNMKSELQDSGKYDKTVYQRLDKILRERIEEVNPSTGEPYFYLQDGIYGKDYPDFPKLKDVRGKILIKTGDKSKFGVDFGGWKDASQFTSEYTGGSYYLPEQDGAYSDSPEKRVKDVIKFGEKHVGKLDLPRRADEHLVDNRSEYGDNKPIYFKVSTNCTDAGWWDIPGDSPIHHVEKVHPKIFGEGKIYNYGNAGKYVGWGSNDGGNVRSNSYFWKTNYFDDLNNYYRTITVQSGVEGIPDQTYQLVQGTPINIPGFIYGKYNNVERSDFKGWKCGEQIYNIGDTLKVEDDMVFTAQWESQAPQVNLIRLKWKDADNKDGIRPTSLDVKVNGTENTLSFTAMTFWTKVTTETISSLVPTGDVVTGTDGEGTYKYELSGDATEGWALTLVHTPNDVKTFNVTVRYEDNDAGMADRPDSLVATLYKNGAETMHSVTLSADNSWQETLATLPLYEEGEAVHYDIAVSSVLKGGNPYDVGAYYDCVIDAFDSDYNAEIVYTAKNMVSVYGTLYWDNIPLEERPDSVTLKLWKYSDEGDIIVDTCTLDPHSDEGIDIWSFDLIWDDPEHPDYENYYITGENPVGWDINYTSFFIEEGLRVTATYSNYAHDYDWVMGIIDRIGEVSEEDYVEKKPLIVMAYRLYQMLSDESKQVLATTMAGSSETTYLQVLVNAHLAYILYSLKNVTNVENLIEAIGEVEATEACYNKIRAAREAYEALAWDERETIKTSLVPESEVTYYDVLVQAELDYEDLMRAGERVDRVESLIDDIPDAVVPDDACRSAIEDAIQAYEKLSASEKEAVSNYADLVAAKQAFDTAYAQLLETVETFAKDYVKATGEACPEGRSVSENYSALEKIYQGENGFTARWAALSEEARDFLQYSSTEIEAVKQLRERYVSVVTNYGVNFLFSGWDVANPGPTPAPAAESVNPLPWIIGGSIAAVIAAAICVTFIVVNRKKKHQ